MSQKLMDTEIGGEQTQYEGEHTDVQPHKKSGGQFSDPQTTTDPNNTVEAQQQHRERGEKTAENMRYGQTISEGGLTGFTANQSGEATQDGYGAIGNRAGNIEDEAEQSRRAAGYGGKEDQNREVGA